MFGVAFFNGQPTDYIIKYVGGKPVSSGMGSAFYYLTLNTQVTLIMRRSRSTAVSIFSLNLPIIPVWPTDFPFCAQR